MQSQEKLRIMDSITLGNNDVETSRTNKSSTIPSPDVNSNMVYLNIYDLDNVSKVINSVAKPIGTGAFHAGVEVYGYEYSFGYVSNGKTGVMKSNPRYHPHHVYRESISMVIFFFFFSNKNCLNYADYFCNLLDVGGVPDWLMSLQKNLIWVKSNINVASSKLKELNKASGLPNVLNYVKKKCIKKDEKHQKCKVVLK
ncbi:PPPDE peptidase, putative [Plasmodium berghei]|uniref:PPPDE peptidase, putative n=1 Tax=Plasmodium berghei TaxID=5821 RepID=A0A1C6YMB5_PLABE|nr:PPPDE peptidase, putative [Plasmodium berghei]SCN27095.1 PPPDE peptidase, putative [Plasmodium berghei]SCO61594.1 PPPDE peptidase, putative [Plasmodium berghei]SCO63517.1 PPPDE peptidase, putative [Plasmodium berghei]